MWRLLELSIHHHEPSVTTLQFHLPGDMSVLFDNAEEALANARAGQPPTTKLMAYFDLLQADERFRDVRYTDIVKYCTWQKANDEQPNRWEPRKRGDRGMGQDELGRYRKNAVGRMQAVGQSARQADVA